MGASPGDPDRGRRTCEGLGPPRDGTELMARYLLDTNHVGAVLDDRSALRERLYHSLKSGHRIATCVPVLCELETGIHQTHRRDHNRRVLAVFLRQIRIWPLNSAIAPLYSMPKSTMTCGPAAGCCPKST